MPSQQTLAAGLAVTLALVPLGQGGDTPFGDRGHKALEWTKLVVGLGPRPPGSEAHERQQRLILAELKARADAVEQHSFVAHTPRGDLPMSNLIGKFEGASDRIVVVSGHYDTFHRAGLEFVGANDGGSSTGFLLALAGFLEGRELPDDVWLVFFDGEESIVSWKDEDHTYGSRALSRKWTGDGTLPRIKALINVDMIGDADLAINLDAYAAPWLRELVWEMAGELGYEDHFPPGHRSFIQDDHIPFAKAGVDVVNLIDFHYGPQNSYWHTEQDAVDKLSPESFSIMLHVVFEAIERLGEPRE